MSKVYTPFKTKTVHGEWKHYRLGRHLHLYGLYWGVPPPPDQMKLNNSPSTTQKKPQHQEKLKIFEILFIQVTW